MDLTLKEKFFLLSEYWSWTGGILPIDDDWEKNDISAGKDFFAEEYSNLVEGGIEAIIAWFEQIDQNGSKYFMSQLKVLKGAFPEHESEIEAWMSSGF